MKYFKLVLILCVGLVRADGEYFGTILLENGGTIIPNVAVPTPAEVISTASAATAAKASADSATATLQALATTAAMLQAETSALNGAAIVYGSCTSFGSQAVESATNATAQLLAINLTSNVVGLLYIDIYTRFSDTPASMPTVEFSQTLAAGGVTEWAGLADLGSVLTTYPFQGNVVECYKNTVSVPSSNPSGFFRVKGEAQQTIIGQFLVIYGGFSVNGIVGKTVYVDGLGQFVFGFLGDLVEE